VVGYDVLLDQEYPGAGTFNDPYHVSWITDDPENPKRLPMHEKAWTTFFVSFSTMATNICSSAYSGAGDSIRADFGVSTTLVTLGLSCKSAWLYSARTASQALTGEREATLFFLPLTPSHTVFVLGFACGPLFWAPLSEVFGRRNLFIISYASLALWSAVSIASPNFGSFMVFRFLAGACGSSSLTNSGGTISDLFDAKQRGIAMCFAAISPFMGPALGPIIGGFIGMAGGWKWVLAFLAILNGTIALLGLMFFAETYAPRLLRTRAQELSGITGNVYVSSTDVGKDIRLTTLVKTTIGRPWLLIFYEPIVSLLGLYIGFVYATLYSFFEAFPIVFQQVRGWNPGVGGLPFLGILVGMLIAIAYIMLVANKDYARRLDADPNMPSEVRLLPALIGAPLFVVGLAGFAATDSPTIQWIVSVRGQGTDYGCREQKIGQGKPPHLLTLLSALSAGPRHLFCFHRCSHRPHLRISAELPGGLIPRLCCFGNRCQLHSAFGPWCCESVQCRAFLAGHRAHSYVAISTCRRSRSSPRSCMSPGQQAPVQKNRVVSTSDQVHLSRPVHWIAQRIKTDHVLSSFAAIAAAIALLFMPFPYLFLRRGEQIRRRCKYSAEALKLSERLAKNLEK
jgi:MFS family permease